MEKSRLKHKNVRNKKNQVTGRGVWKTEANRQRSPVVRVIIKDAGLRFPKVVGFGRPRAWNGPGNLSRKTGRPFHKHHQWSSCPATAWNTIIYDPKRVHSPIGWKRCRKKDPWVQNSKQHGTGWCTKYSGKELSHIIGGALDHNLQCLPSENLLALSVENGSSSTDAEDTNTLKLQWPKTHLHVAPVEQMPWDCSGWTNCTGHFQPVAI